MEENIKRFIARKKLEGHKLELKIKQLVHDEDYAEAVKADVALKTMRKLIEELEDEA